MLLNLGILISPFIGGAILNTQGFTVLYSVAALILVPFVFFLNRYMKHAQEPVYHTINMNRALYHIFRNKDLRGATVAIFLLEYFYATMIIYFPLYLTSLGISLITYLTVIIPISLIPLVVLPYELGILADKKYGEKEMLILGMILMAATVLILSVMTTTYMLWWIAVLFVSRIGATCVETMAYSYFYKKINPEDVSLTAVFSNMRSVATVIASIAGIILAPLVMTYPQVIFIVLALALLFGVTYIIPIKDTL
jgi:MFS family permease